jgi:mannosyltransferase OCH1-like enzyme
MKFSKNSKIAVLLSSFGSSRRLTAIIFLGLCLTSFVFILLGVSWQEKPLKWVPLQAKRAPILAIENNGEVVPRIIHQTYRTTQIPFRWMKSRYSVLKQHPASEGWQHMFWTDNKIRSFIQANYTWFLPTFDSYPYPVQKVDAFRYFALYHYGGIYLDLDVGARQSLAGLLHYPVIFPKTEPIGFSNDFMVANPKHPLFHRIIHNLHNYNHYYLFPFFTVLMSTGPCFLSFMYYWSPEEVIKDVFILPEELYSKPGESMLTHVEGNSWLEWDGEILQFILVKHPQKFYILFILLIGSLVTVIVRGLYYRCFSGKLDFSMEGKKISLGQEG